MKLYELKAILPMLDENCEVIVKPPEKEDTKPSIGFSVVGSEEKLLELKGERNE